MLNFFSVLFSMYLFCSCNPTKNLKPNELFLQKNKVSIIDHQKLEKEELKKLFKQKTNKEILGFFKFHLFIYNLYSKKNNSAFKETTGEAPVVFDSLLTDRTANQLKLYANKRGYFNSKVNYTIKKHKNKVKVHYQITAGEPYKIDSTEYIFEDEEMKKMSFFILRNTVSSLRKDNVFDIDVLDKQREIIKTEIQNLGYYYFNKNYIKYKVDSSIGNNRIAIKLYINNQKLNSEKSDTLIKKRHEKFKINDVNIYISKNFNNKNINNFDNSSFKDLLIRTDTTNGYKLFYRKRMLNHAILLKKGDFFALKNQKNTYKHLNELRLFKNVSISFDDIGNNQLNTNILLTPSLKKSISIEGVGTNNGGNLGVEGNLIYQNKNFFKGGEQLTIKFNGGLEIQQLINDENTTNTNFFGLFNTLEFGPELNLKFPRFLLPIKLDKFSQKSNPKTNLNFLLNIQNRPEYIRNLTEASFGYFWKSNRFHQHFINPINISIIDLQPTDKFQEQLDNETNPFILNSYQDHFINSTTYSYIFNNQRINKAQDFVYLKTNFEFAGNIQYAYSKINNQTYDNIDTKSYDIMGIRYAQFLKTDFDLRLYGQTKYSSFVKRINIGIGKPYGNLDVLPFEKSYYGGGANGIRAWQARTLGPGSISNNLTETSLNQIGELKIEANLEYRFDITSLFEGATFIDAGNIWTLTEDENRPNAEIKANKLWKDIAIGVGLGLRLDFSFFLIRFDLAAKLKDPGRINPTSFDLIWYKPTLNLGIGYPF